MFDDPHPIGSDAAKIAAERLLSFFPPPAATGPAIFVVGLVQILAAYPPGVVEAALSPLSGLPSKHTFMPSIAEVKVECEKHFEPYRRAMARPRPLPALPAPKFERLTIDELKARYGRNFGLSVGPTIREGVRHRCAELSVRANKTFLDRECAHAGVDAARGYSPTLESLLRSKQSEQIASAPEPTIPATAPAASGSWQTVGKAFTPVAPPRHKPPNNMRKRV